MAQEPKHYTLPNMTVTELEALAFRNMLVLNQTEANLAAIRQELETRQQKQQCEAASKKAPGKKK